MKRILLAAFACLMMFSIVPAVHAVPFFAAVEAPTAPIADPFADLKAKIVPELENILTPEQRTQFDDAIANGTSVKKAFKSIALTPEQKGKVGMMMKSVPKDIFTALTPDQKRELFMQKKDFFMAKGKEKAEEAMKSATDAVKSATDAVKSAVE